MIFSTQISIFAANILIRRDGHARSIGGLAESVWLRDHLLGHHPPSSNTHTHTHTQWRLAIASQQREGEGDESDGNLARNPVYTVYHPAPLRPLSVCQVSWSAAAMTFDPGTQWQGKGYQCLGFLKAKCPGVDGVYTSGKKKKTLWAAEEKYEGEMRTSAIYRPLKAHTQIPSHQCFWSHGRGRGANSARLFTLLISSVVTSRGTHRLTSVWQTSPCRGKSKKKSLKKIYVWFFRPASDSDFLTWCFLADLGPPSHTYQGEAPWYVHFTWTFS